MRRRRCLIGLILLLLAACTTTPGPPIGGGGPVSDAAPVTPQQEPTGAYPIESITEVVEEQAYPLPTIPTTLDNYPPPVGEDPYPAPGSGISDGCQVPPARPVHLAFNASDGTSLVGTYYPPANCSAPLALLFHQNGRSKEIWVDLALWLQNRNGESSAAPGGFLAAPNRQYSWFPPMPQGLSIAVLAVDFRNHGESGGTGGFDPAGFLQDAQAALAMGRSLPEVDPEQVITIGTSIGADAAVDVCINLDGSQVAAEQQDQGCRGALSFSPGNFLGVPFRDAVSALGEPPHQTRVRCLAAEGDGNAPDLCRSDFGSFFSSTIYPGSDHGIDLFMPSRDPDVGTVILEFLIESLGRE